MFGWLVGQQKSVVTAYNFYKTGNRMVMSGSSFLMRCGPGATLFFCEFESKYPVIVGDPTFEPFPSGKNVGTSLYLASSFPHTLPALRNLQLICIYPSFHVKVNNDFEPFATAVEKTGWWLHPPFKNMKVIGGQRPISLVGEKQFLKPSPRFSWFIFVLYHVISPHDWGNSRNDLQKYACIYGFVWK